MRGGPAKAQNMTTMRPFSLRVRIVSTPLPVWSRKATVRVRDEELCRFCLGEQLGSPSPESGAVATKTRLVAEPGR